MGNTLNQRQYRLQLPVVTSVRLKKRRPQSLAQFRVFYIQGRKGFSEYLTHQRITIGMQPARRQADYGVTGRYGLSPYHLLLSTRAL